jgi:hypothetical protein
MLDKVEVDEFYRNKKNRQIYQVQDLATHTETLEHLVVYYSLKDVDKIWVRPLELFKEKFEEV